MKVTLPSGKEKCSREVAVEEDELLQVLWPLAVGTAAVFGVVFANICNTYNIYIVCCSPI